ncbi:polysaccharide biosynthesis/export family protein [Oceanihabitans sediminis]|uniref:Sugar transporter n=1 Tax=Oceanihabitans sediminis TaxID=1812012 RepID=A0A368P4B4_9FLAO|nr:polysaccharide biosynthesis/export family protein [Oceanihabitans sediminis]MDX1279329.1 polysaccharide biosynthesis/export family protein [Oceanihabitans sediminis]MDX1774417.1 polysaccharide biosynthesis/export family protein [Oceanihabitans sediminis]RBP29779.1 protein involved in gliding motility EpsA [Oceanihabitans sediminis]RCU57120.1 sugar transporter [Oceanihabitans sediminis]
MKRLILTLSILASVVVSSCIPHKDTLYVQEKGNKDSLDAIVEQQRPYRIQINDILNIRVKALDQDNVKIFNPIGEKDLNASSVERSYFDGFTVDIHGNIRIPTLGKINVLGYTTEEIEQLLEKKLLEEEFKETANIFVTVKLTGLKYTTTGEIGSKGTKVLFQERVNILEAIANAGDIPVTGDKKDVLIIRQYPQGQKIHHIDLTDVNVMQSPYYYIQPNDMIYVKPLRQKAWGTGTNALQNLGAVATVLSVITTTILLFNRL